MPRVGTDPLLRAARTLDLLGLDQEQPIDVLAAVEGLGLTLAFVPLDRLLGAVVPHGGGGVLVTMQRGIGVQRYTAAHEIGHWVMHQDRLSLDGFDDVLGHAPNERESQAQLFAAYFLMPPPLLWSSLQRLGLVRGAVGPGEAYRLSRELNVSYEAAVRRLASHGWLDRAGARGLLAVQRLKAMAEASGGRRPAAGTAELWEAGLASSGGTLTVTVDDEIVLDLPENRTTPFRWTDAAGVASRPTAVRTRPRAPRAAQNTESPTVEGGPAVRPSGAAARAAVALLPAGPMPAPVPAPAVSDGLILGLSDDFDASSPAAGTPFERSRDRVVRASGDAVDEDAVVGAAGLRRLQVRCLKEGRTSLHLAYAHAYDAGQRPAATWRLDVDVRASLPTRQRQALVAGVDLDERLPGDPDDGLRFG